MPTVLEEAKKVLVQPGIVEGTAVPNAKGDVALALALLALAEQLGVVAQAMQQRNS